MAGTPIDPSYQFRTVTPSDTAPLLYPLDFNPTTGVAQETPARTKAIYVGGAGNLSVRNDRLETVTFIGLPAGSMFPISTDRIFSTLTTCTNIIALY